MTRYEFGTREETADGKIFRVIASGEYDSDAQAEHQARLILGSPEDYDLTDLNGDQTRNILIRRDGAVWGA